jgi:hypothetical protein
LIEYLKRHIQSINRFAGCRVLSEESAVEFIQGLLTNRPDAKMLEAVRRIIADVRIKNKPAAEADCNRLSVLNGCLDIAASAVTEYPYGLTERFTTEEKDYYHKIQKLLGANPDDYPLPVA